MAVRSRPLDGPAPTFTLDDGREVVSFASNDYLGLTQHPAVVAAAHAALDRWGAGSGSARLIVGDRPVHVELEAELAAWKGTEAALLFPTGFAANLGVLTTFGGPGVLVVQRRAQPRVDHRRLPAGPRRRGRLPPPRRRPPRRRCSPAGPAIVVTDTVFSMDGDVAPLDDRSAVCARHGALLVLDEAHAVLGPEPAPDGVDVLRVGTLSKTLGSLGGFVAGPQAVHRPDGQRAPGRSSSPPRRRPRPVPRPALAALRYARRRGVAVAPAAGARRARRSRPPVADRADRARRRAAGARRRRPPCSSSGCSCPPSARRPSPPGTSRLRVALSAAHTDDQVDRLAKALADL